MKDSFEINNMICISKVVTLNAHKITKETVAVKYTINAEGFVGQGTLIIIVEFLV